MSDFAARLRHDPSLYPHSLEPVSDALLMVEMSPESFAAASFLDQRILGPQTPGRWAAAQAIDATMAEVAHGPIGYIFHIGHVGSTLLARIMGAHAAVHSLREPATLRTMARLLPDLETAESQISPAAFERRLATLAKLWGRTYAPGQRTIVKATSFASELAERLLALPAATPSLAMHVKPEVYIASILGGETSRQELQTLVQPRLRRLHKRLGAAAWRLYELGIGERAAASWASEMVTLESVDAGRLSWIDFQAFLADPQAGLATAFAATGFAVDAVEVAAIATGPLMTRYSKGPEHAYTPELRGQVLDQAREEHGADIARGMAWLEAAGRDHPLIAKALDR
ncbi:hypothetical protein ACFOMD_05960 [Sphingoaurantiacus capsulatus]|uniref:Uncharacterized protein n=1 Tax=Sphingoaurantiacus capsulatus TaxID=1771310 RepID=A0ABV7XAP3_9SPHN